jgi:hypothetical protein
MIRPFVSLTKRVDQTAVVISLWDIIVSLVGIGIIIWLAIIIT